jgi:hypothetical protein
MSNVAMIEPRPERAPLVAGAKPMAIVPTTMEEAYRLANAVCEAGMAPNGLNTPPKAMIAILHGLEIGLTPMAALQRIAVVNGRPVLWGDGAVGLVRASGLCEWLKERIEGEGDKRVAVCEAKRRNEPEPIIRMFSVADAKRAGLWEKQGPWRQYPERMLQMRARAFALRDGFADALGGLYLREEIEADEPARAPAPPQIAATAQSRRAPPPPQLVSAPVSSPESKAEGAGVSAPLTAPAPEASAVAAGGGGGARRAPAPPAPLAVANHDAAIDAYRDALKAAANIGSNEAALEAVESAWATHIAPIESELMQHEYEEASSLDNAAREAIAP